MIAIGRHVVGLVLAAVSLASFACSAREEVAAIPVFAASRSASSGELNVSIFVSTQELGIADRCTVLFEARNADAKPVVWPQMLKAVDAGNGFPPNPSDPGVTDWNVLEATRRTLAPGHETLELVLEPYLNGDKPIPAMEFVATNGSVHTEPIAVKVIAEHTLAGGNEVDPLKAIAALSAPLRTPLPPRPWMQHPLTWGIAATCGIVVLGCLAGVLGMWLSSRRTFTPDQQFELSLVKLRNAAMGQQETPGQLTESVSLEFRRWLIATGRIKSGATGIDLIAWVRASGVSSSVSLANHLEEIEKQRFAPQGEASHPLMLGLIECLTRFMRELRELRAQEGPQRRAAA